MESPIGSAHIGRMKILVIGATGFVGRHLAKSFQADGIATRCLARSPDKAADLEGCEIVKGDLLDLASLRAACEGVHAVYNTAHTLSRQQSRQGFMEIELTGLRNLVQACKEQGVRRLLYMTFMGIAADSPSEWSRERWKAEQLLLQSGLDVTILRTAQIVGFGGAGFNMMMSQAQRRFTPVLGQGKGRMQNIAIADLVYYLRGVLDEPRSFGGCYAVGCDEVLTSDQMIDIAAEVLGRPHPFKAHLPAGLLSVLAPLIERLAHMPRGAIRGLADGVDGDLTGDVRPIRALLPRPPMSYRQAVEAALAESRPR